jgi:GDP-L-fucose synthase
VLNKNSRIFLAGHNGLVGSSTLVELKKNGFKNIITVDRKKLDLQNYSRVEKYFSKKKIDVIIIAAARAGGILANNSFQKDFFFQNIEIQNSLLKIAVKKKVKKVVFLGTSCIYPKYAKNPITEDRLLTGSLEKTNQCYAIAKIAGIKLCEALFYDHSLDVVCLMPTNIYGIKDNFDKNYGHVIPAMIEKFLYAKKNNLKKVVLFGTGKPIREFLFSDDLASAIVKIISSQKKKIMRVTNNKFPIINVGSGESVTIKKLSRLIKKLTDYKGNVFFDKKYPDGTFKKNLDSSKIRKLDWEPKVNLLSGLTKVINARKSIC